MSRQHLVSSQQLVSTQSAGYSATESLHSKGVSNLLSSQQFTQQSALTPICRFGWLFEGVLSAESAQVLSQTMRILPTRDDQRGYVYLFEEIGGNGVPTGYYKIGKTTQNAIMMNH